MNSLLKRPLFMLAVLAVSFLPTLHAQTMPQDNWRYDGVNFGSPVTNNSLQVITSGSGGIYIGEVVSGSSSPTRILRFTEDGTFVSRFVESFTHILGMGTDSAGNVYVYDRGFTRVKVYSPTGAFLRQWGGVGTANGLFTISNSINTSNILAVSSEDEVFVCDPGNTRVQVFSTAGAFLRKWGALGALPGQFPENQPQNIVVGSDGLVWLNEGKRFKKNGEYNDSVGINSFTPYCISKDNMCAAIGQSHNRITNRDLSSGGYPFGTPINIGATSTSTFSKNGSYYSVSGNKCYRHVREYTSAINFLNPLPLPQAEIISSSQRVGTNLVDLSYRVTDTDSPTVTTGLIAFIEGGNSLPYVVPMKTFVENTVGNVGVNQPVDTIRNVVWNMPADWSVTYANVQVEAMAKDTRNLMGIHWITVPPSNGEPAIQVSYQGIYETDLYQLWLWLLATDQNIALTRTSPPSAITAIINGNSGIFNGTRLADWNITSNGNQRTSQSGRVYALKKMGARPITDAELARARAGNYGFSTNITSGQPEGGGPSFIVKDDTVATSYIKAAGSISSINSNLQTFASNNPVSIDAGSSHNLFIRSDGSLWGYGANGQGQLGLGHTSDQSGPVKIADGVAQVSAGANHSVFVKTNGTLWAMGSNGNGQLGDNSTTQRSSPVQIDTGVAYASAGTNHTLFVKTNGTAWAMGSNNYGQLGDASNTQRLSPVQVTVASDFSKVEAAGEFSFFIKTNAALWATGRNDRGQLGTGNTGNLNAPILVQTAVATVSGSLSSEGFSLCVKTTGTLFVTGYNAQGQLGDGTATSRSTFFQLPSVTGVTKAACGNNHSVFRKTDGTLAAMGENGSGQLGDGTTTNRNTPVVVSGASNVTDVSSGASNTVYILPATP